MKSGPVTVQINLGGSSSAISVAKGAATIYKITWNSINTAGTNFARKWCANDFQAVLLDQRSNVVQSVASPICTTLAPNVVRFTMSGSIAPGAYVLEFRRTGIALGRAINAVDTRKGNSTVTYTAAQSAQNIDFTVADAVAGRRVVLLIHGIFGSTTNDSVIKSWVTPKLPPMPCANVSEN